jgi:hypothetical protein
VEEKVKIDQEEHAPPIWIKLLWGLLLIWGLLYLSLYWVPDLQRWSKTTDPDGTQWQDYQ